MAVDDRPPPPRSSDDSADTGPIQLDGPAQRQHPRIALALSVRLRFASVGAVLESRTVDVSEGGVFIRMNNPRPEGTSIRLVMEIGDEQLTIGGVVVRCVKPGEGEEPGIGVLFTDIDPNDRARVQALVREAFRSH